MSAADLFEVTENDTVWEAWLTTVNLIDILERTRRVGELYDFNGARDKVSKINGVAEKHWLDRNEGGKCKCGLSDAEHQLVKRKILTFYRLQVNNLKHFLD